MELPVDAASDETLSWYRGKPLWSFDTDFRLMAGKCRDLGIDLDVDHALSVWDVAVNASRAATPLHTWLHGDLVAENLLVDTNRRLAAVIDFGGLAIGDPTVDLVVAWEVLDSEGRDAFRRELDLDAAAWAASRGWALYMAMMTFSYYGATMPRRCADRLAMAQAAVAAG